MKHDTIRAVLGRGVTAETTTVAGWVRTRRSSKTVSFIELSDGSGPNALQVVVANDSAAAQELARIATGTAVTVTGRLVASQGKGQSVELVAEALTVLGEADPESYPLQKKGHSLEFLREIGHLRPRTNTFSAMTRIRQALAFEIHRFFDERGFYWVPTPILTAGDCEGAGELFTVTTLKIGDPPRGDRGQVDYTKDFFGRQAYLTVSGQLQGEAFAMAMGRIYTFGPTFRAENSNTARHLAEFWMIEPECAFFDLDDDMALAEEFLREVIRGTLRRCGDDLTFLGKHYDASRTAQLEQVTSKGFTRISYTDAITELEKVKGNFQFPVQWGVDLQTEHERFLSETLVGGPVIVYNYPKAIKAFYMRANDDGRTVAAMDVLCPGIGEVIGGSQREERHDVLRQRMAAVGIPEADLAWYLELRRWGSAPHAGFGLGFERLLQYVTGMTNIRDAIPFPRTPGSIAF